MTIAANLLRRARPASAATRGTTLVEVMIVLTIISLITTLVGTIVFGQLIKAQRKTTNTQRLQIASTLDLYRLEFRRYPSSAEGLQALTQPRGRGEALMASVPGDAWDQPYIYVSPGVNNPRSYDLHSMGEDGIDGTEDDITNWTEFEP